MSIKIGDKVRVTGRPEEFEVMNQTATGLWDLSGPGYYVRVPKSWLTMVEEKQDPETEIRSWEPGECGVDIDGDKWVRLHDGAVVYGKDAEVPTVYSDRELSVGPLTARKDPTLKFTFAWKKQ